MNRLRCTLLVVFLLCGAGPVSAKDHNTDWLKDARYGVFMHFLPHDAESFARVDEFDVEHVARQLEDIGAKYFVLTLGQNSGYCNSPNAAYDKYTGYALGERCAKRDLPLDLYRALHPKGIRLMLYLPCQVPNRDPRAQKAFGLAQGRKDQPIDLEFADKWAEVIRHWAQRYGDKVGGWWFDGAYAHVGFNEAIARVYAGALKSGNPRAIVTFNPGVRLIRHARAEDYTAGELNEPFGVVPSSRWVKGSQWHALTFMGTRWSSRDTRYPTEQWVQWVRKVAAKQGVVTLDMGPNWDPQSGPIGSLSESQMTQLKAIKAALIASGGEVRNARADMMSDSPIEFPQHGALPAKYSPDRPSKNREEPEEGYFIFNTPERSLAQIAKIQSEMPIGRFSAPPQDWTHLARTRRILTNGGQLHLLAVGDSIVNDTMRSGWVAKLQEAYPKAEIRATVYVRGGGGCQHYKEEDRIAKHVVPRKPDLVLIGGISQRDTESIREVVRQLRAALPEVEILLVTGVFGRADPRDPESLAKARHSGTGAYGKSLKKLAVEQQCAYLDMTTPWAQYIRSANVHPHFFYRDVVHANEQGEQILSKILMAFWRPEPNEATLPRHQ